MESFLFDYIQFQHIKFNGDKNVHSNGLNGDTNDINRKSQQDIVQHDFDEEMQMKCTTFGVISTSGHSDTESTEGTSQNGDKRSNDIQSGHTDNLEELMTEDFAGVILKLEKSINNLNVEFLRNPTKKKFQAVHSKRMRVWSQVGIYLDKVFFVILFISYVTIIAFYGSRIF